MKDSDFLCNGYNKYHLWTFLYYHYQTDPHDKNTGEIRGLLCSDCNRGLGCFNDDTEIMEKAISYLKKDNKNE